MPRVEFYRVDLPVRLESLPEGVVRISIGSSAQRVVETRFGSAAVALSGILPEIGPDAFLQYPAPRDWSQQVDRIVLEIAGRELAAEPWEAVFTSTAHLLRHPDPSVTWNPSWVVVRTCPVRPRFLSTPFTLPLRILQLSPSTAHPIGGWVRSLFGSRPQPEVDRAVLTAASDVWQAPDSWPTVDVLHVDVLPIYASPAAPFDVLLTSSQPSVPATLGWFARWTERWQTRLVVLHCQSPELARIARSLAHALCDKGGPAVLVLEPAAPYAYQQLYNQLIHDFPLDQIIIQTSGSWLEPPSLFAGSGREEGVRVSNLAVSLVSLGRPSHEEIAALAYDLWQQRGSPHGSAESDWYRAEFELMLRASSSYPQLAEFMHDWDSWAFDLHERDGLLPMSASLEKLRNDPYRSLYAPPSQPSPTAPRFVNSSFWTGPATDLKQLSQTGAPLDVGAVYQLRIEIGPRDIAIRILDVEALFEEPFKWSPEKKGVWIEFGVAGIDFDVIGDPVQELWLPREGPSDLLYFAVRPARAGIASLRFGLYYQNNLMQSFLLAAMTQGQDQPPGTASDLARTLRISADRLQGERHLARLEYSRISEFSDVEKKPGRALTITANQLDGRSIFVTKGDDVFSAAVYPDDNIGKIVTKIRGHLNEISYEPPPAGGEPIYRFGPYRGDLEERCKAALLKLAAPGRGLYGNLAPSEKQKTAIQAILGGEPKTIHIASILREKVIPWAFVYDGPYDEDKKNDQGRPVEQGVCTAWLDHQAANVRPVACGEHPDCLLNPSAQNLRTQTGGPLYHERTVVCPRHFWGFRHILEVPPRQTDGGAAGAAEPASIKPTQHIRLVAGMNATLGRHAEHWRELCSIQVWPGPEYDRDALLDALKDDLLDFVYFYCHARGGQADPGIDPPYLEFEAPGSGAPGIIKPHHLEEKAWSHRPLVFLNACGSLGYSPDALSPFLKTLVEGRDASGVLGTEVPVAEALAAQVACAFMTKFLKEGKSAGQALLEVRRALLSRYNPLGLVYTLFAPADLIVDLQGP